MIIFRENSEDVYAGIEWEAGTPEVGKVIQFLQNEMGVDKIRFPETSGIGIKPISSEGTGRIVRAAIKYAIDNDKDSVTLVHKGNIMKFTEGGFRDWGINWPGMNLAQSFSRVARGAPSRIQKTTEPSLSRM